MLANRCSRSVLRAAVLAAGLLAGPLRAAHSQGQPPNECLFPDTQAPVPNSYAGWTVGDAAEDVDDAFPGFHLVIVDQYGEHDPTPGEMGLYIGHNARGYAVGSCVNHPGPVGVVLSQPVPPAPVPPKVYWIAAAVSAVVAAAVAAVVASAVAKSRGPD